MDIEALAIAYRSQAARTGVHPNAIACDMIACVTESVASVSRMRSPDPVLLKVLLDNLHEHVLLLKFLNGVAE